MQQTLSGPRDVRCRAAIHAHAVFQKPPSPLKLIQSKVFWRRRRPSRLCFKHLSLNVRCRHSSWSRTFRYRIGIRWDLELLAGRSKTGYDESETVAITGALGGTRLQSRMVVTRRVRKGEHNQDNSTGKTLSSCRK